MYTNISATCNDFICPQTGRLNVLQLSFYDSFKARIYVQHYTETIQGSVFISFKYDAIIFSRVSIAITIPS